ncbi:uncharacterized protein LOC107265138 [Cephus cinctus]|uniref:Uncharacterized protein LOC107265138 n=1 Tax=Cephus cinctus TaxID=211228 RepID=A0AAJ7FFT8_CEPCN|nr:uncharacterized protein LOC107265138 [Cephus cinctus]
MAVLRRASEDLPKNAVILDTNEAIRFQWNYIFDYQPKYEMWPFRYGLPMLSIFAGASTMYINSCFRQGYRLKQYGRVASYLPLTVAPTFLGFILQRKCVTDEILLQTVPCPLCLYSRAVGIQLAAGILYPMGLAPIGNIMIALRYATVRIPEIKDFKGHLTLFKKVTKPLISRLPYLVCAHMITAVFITNREMKAFTCFYDKLLREEEAITEMSKSYES